MSWGIEADGTVDELRAEVRKHEDHYWRDLPRDERLLIHHLIGHQLEVADGWVRVHGPRRFHLHGWGHQDEDHYLGTSAAEARIDPIHDPAPPADPGS